MVKMWGKWAPSHYWEMNTTSVIRENWVGNPQNDIILKSCGYISKGNEVINQWDIWNYIFTIVKKYTHHKFSSIDEGIKQTGSVSVMGCQRSEGHPTFGHNGDAYDVR